MSPSPGRNAPGAVFIPKSGAFNGAGEKGGKSCGAHSLPVPGACSEAWLAEADPPLLKRIMEEQLYCAKAIVRELESLPGCRLPCPGIEGSLAELEARLADERLYLGVVGEISCGKSAFVNAFAQRPWLAADPLPGLTGAPAILAKASFETAALQCQSGCIRHCGNAILSTPLSAGPFSLLRCVVGARESPGEQAMRQFLAGAGTRDDGVEQVAWLAPFPGLWQDLVLVDTPGIDSMNPRHRRLARRAAGACDALLILTHLDAPLSMRLLAEVRQIAGPKAANCIFVGTHADHFDERARKRLRAYLESRLASAFGRALPLHLLAVPERDARQNWLPALDGFRAAVRSRLDSEGCLLRVASICRLLAEALRGIRANLDCLRELFQKDSAEEKFCSNSGYWNDAGFYMNNAPPQCGSRHMVQALREAGRTQKNSGAKRAPRTGAKCRDAAIQSKSRLWPARERCAEYEALLARIDDNLKLIAMLAQKHACL